MPIVIMAEMQSGAYAQPAGTSLLRIARRRIAELYALNDHVGYLIGERVDIKLTVPDAVKGLKVA